jgi:RsiW-degrading membrane proteinase PrsW (M82 family)
MGSNSLFLIIFVVFVGIIYLIVKIIMAGIPNTPTWKGIIISALLGMLPLYLVLCFFGVMGEERKRP